MKDKITLIDDIVKHKVDFSALPDWAWDDKEVLALSMRSSRFEFFHKISRTLQQEELLAFQYFTTRRCNDKDLPYIPPALLEDVSFISLAISKRPDIYTLLPKQLRYNPTVIGMLRQSAVDYLSLMDDDFKKDFTFCEEVVNSESVNYQYIDQSLKNNPKFYMKFYKNMDVVPMLPLEALDNEKIAKSLLRHDTSSFQYFSERIRSMPEFAKKAASNTAMIAFFGKNLLNDIEFMMPILKNDLNAYAHLSEDIKTNKELVIQLTKRHKDIDVALNCILPFISENIAKDKEFITTLFSRYNIHSNIYKLLHSDLRNDMEFSKSFILKEWENLQYAGEKIKNHKGFITQVMNHHSFRNYNITGFYCVLGEKLRSNIGLIKEILSIGSINDAFLESLPDEQLRDALRNIKGTNHDVHALLDNYKLLKKLDKDLDDAPLPTSHRVKI